MAHPSEQRLKRGQVLTENWEIKYEGVGRHGPVEVRAMLKTWPNTTYYASGVEAETVDQARLMLVLQQARAICDDENAFQHDADELANQGTLRWFNSKLQELKDEIEMLEDEDEPAKSHTRELRRLQRRIKLVEQLTAEWQEDNDFWPEEADDTDTEATRRTDRKAVVAAISAAAISAEAKRARTSQD